MSEIISLPDWKRRYHIEAEHTIKECEGCETPILTGDKFCAGCGADQADLFGRILALVPDDVAPLANASGDRWSDAAAKDIRAVLKREGLKGISVTVGRGTARGYVTVRLPKAHAKTGNLTRWKTPEYEPCDTLAVSRRYGVEEAICAACHRRYAAGRHLEHVLYRALPHLADRSDLMTDYFDFVFHVD